MSQRIKRYFKELYKNLIKTEMGVLPASLAFYFVLAIIPLLTIIVLIASSFSISIDFVIELIDNILPEQAASYIVEIISGKGFDRNVGFFNFIAFILALNGTYAIIKVSNTMYKVRKTNYIKSIIKAIILLLLILMLFVFLLVVPMFGEKILVLIRNSDMFNGTINEFIILFKIIKWPLTFLIIYFNIKLLYAVAPSCQVLSKDTTYGALLTTILWMIFTGIFGYYLRYFARYDIIYGNLSSIIILMIWLYALSYVFVLGIAINTTNYNNIEENDNNKK